MRGSCRRGPVLWAQHPAWELSTLRGSSAPCVGAWHRGHWGKEKQRWKGSLTPASPFASAHGQRSGAWSGQGAEGASDGRRSAEPGCPAVQPQAQTRLCLLRSEGCFSPEPALPAADAEGTHPLSALEGSCGLCCAAWGLSRGIALISAGRPLPHSGWAGWGVGGFSALHPGGCLTLPGGAPASLHHSPSGWARVSQPAPTYPHPAGSPARCREKMRDPCRAAWRGLLVISDAGSEVQPASQNFCLQELGRLVNHPKCAGPCGVSCPPPQVGAELGGSEALGLTQWAVPGKEAFPAGMSRCSRELRGAMLCRSSSEPWLQQSDAAGSGCGGGRRSGAGPALPFCWLGTFPGAAQEASGTSGWGMALGGEHPCCGRDRRFHTQLRLRGPLPGDLHAARAGSAPAGWHGVVPAAGGREGPSAPPPSRTPRCRSCVGGDRRDRGLLLVIRGWWIRWYAARRTRNNVPFSFPERPGRTGFLQVKLILAVLSCHRCRT